MISLFVPALLATPFERDGKIIGGVAAKRGQFPNQVAILRSSGSIYCGGSILTESIVLTAAHCKMANVANFKVLAGSLSYINYQKENGQLRSIAKFTPHKQYENVGNGFDIALVKVTQPFQFNSFVQSIELSSSGEYPTGSVVASGWGLTIDGDNNSIPEFLQTVILSAVKYSHCARSWGRLPANVLCATLPGKDTCQGDSGGPLAENIGGKLVQVGITSFGEDCASKTLPGIYTEVTKYIDWINRTTAKM